MRRSRGLLLAALLQLVALACAEEAGSAAAPAPPVWTLADLIKDQTVQHHTGRATPSLLLNTFSSGSNSTGLAYTITSLGAAPKASPEASPAAAPEAGPAAAPAAAPGEAASPAAEPAAAPQEAAAAAAPGGSPPPSVWTATAGSAAAPGGYDVFVVDGDPIVVPVKPGQSYSHWAAPVAVAGLLLLAAGGGLFFVWRRRRQRAAPYYGLNEAEMGRMHRNI